MAYMLFLLLFLWLYCQYPYHFPAMKFFSHRVVYLEPESIYKRYIKFRGPRSYQLREKWKLELRLRIEDPSKNLEVIDSNCRPFLYVK